MITEIRNNDRVIFEDIPLAEELFKRVFPTLSQYYGEWKAIAANERFRCYRYGPGQRFAMHRDGAFVRNNNERSMVTLLIYLNDDYQGGETYFLKTGQAIKGKPGSALLFIHSLAHEGSEVTQGLKYILRSDIMYQREAR